MRGDNGPDAVPSPDEGDDKMTGGKGNDHMIGDTGNDRLDGGLGDDFTDGRLGNDLHFSDPAGADEITDSDADTDTDTLDVSDRTADLNFTMGVDGADDGQAGEGDSVDSEIDIVLSGTGSDFFEDNWDPSNRFVANAGNDLFNGHRAGPDVFEGGEGTDTLNYDVSGIYFRVEIDLPAGEARSLEAPSVQMLTTFSSVERFHGGSPGDVIKGSLFGDFLNGAGGNDTIRGDNTNPAGFGADEIRGGTGDDSLFGDNGDDQLHGESGNDTLNGGDGKDLMVGGADADIFDGGEPTSPEEDSADWQNPPDGSCASANGCP